MGTREPAGSSQVLRKSFENAGAGWVSKRNVWNIVQVRRDRRTLQLQLHCSSRPHSGCSQS